VTKQREVKSRTWFYFFFANIVCLRHDAGVLLPGQRAEPLRISMPVLQQYLCVG
jgi:hypothetical protein